MARKSLFFVPVHTNRWININFVQEVYVVESMRNLDEKVGSVQTLYVVYLADKDERYEYMRSPIKEDAVWAANELIKQLNAL